jgi:hypothetical protein
MNSELVRARASSGAWRFPTVHGGNVRFAIEACTPDDQRVLIQRELVTVFRIRRTQTPIA